MEAHGCRDFPPDSARGRFVRAALSAAVADVIVPVFAGQVAQAALAGRPLTRDMCGRAMTYLQARTHYGVVDPAALCVLAPIWEQVLGRADVRRARRAVRARDLDRRRRDRAADRRRAALPRDHRTAGAADEPTAPAANGPVKDSDRRRRRAERCAADVRGVGRAAGRRG